MPVACCTTICGAPAADVVVAVARGRDDTHDRARDAGGRAAAVARCGLLERTSTVVPAGSLRRDFSSKTPSSVQVPLPCTSTVSPPAVRPTPTLPPVPGAAVAPKEKSTLLAEAKRTLVGLVFRPAFLAPPLICGQQSNNGAPLTDPVK